MIAATLTALPMAAGGAVLASAGRTAAWVVGLYMRAPLANTAAAALIGFSSLATGNALYWQRHEHPAPLFAPASELSEPALIEPVVPAVRKRPAVLSPLTVETTGSVPDVLPDLPIGNSEVREMQRKLQLLRLFDGEVDGLYGPQTARSIKDFENANGLEPKGMLTREILDAIAAAQLGTGLTRVEPLPEADPLPAVTVKKQSAEPLATMEPLDAPEPLALAADARPSREIPDTPEEAVELVVETAGDAIDTIIDGVQFVAMTRPVIKDKPAELQFVPDPATKPVTVADLPAPLTAEPANDVAVVASTRAIAPVVVEDEPEVAMTSDDVPELDTDAKPEEVLGFSVTDPSTVARVQRGLASLGFLHGPADGIAGEATAKAIRNFEVYYNYKVTGRISAELPDLLVANGASI